VLSGLVGHLGGAKGYDFTEELLVENLPDSHVLFKFEFNSVWNHDNTNKTIKNYDLFPKRLGDIISKFKIEELKLSLSQGTWKYDKWGLPSSSSPSGSELWAAFEQGLSNSVTNEYWLQSSRTISGLFGLSINLIDNPNTVQPKYLFPGTNLRYASIPNEIVCTENLTPWIKLLPCGKYKGIGKLFRNSPKLFEAQYLSMGLSFQQKCLDHPNCQNVNSQVKQTLSLVYNIDLINNRKTLNDEFVWSFQNILTNKISNVCPVANLSNVYMNLGAGIPPIDRFTNKVERDNKNIYVYDLKKILSNADDFNPLIISKKIAASTNDQLVSIHRYITDSNERNFGLKSLITNNHEANMTVVYLDTIPWHFRVYISTLQIQKDDQIIVEPEKIHFLPGSDRKKPHHLELVLNLAPHSVYSVYFQVEYAYLKWDEYPPDVNHGFYINPVLISIKMDPNGATSQQLKGHYFNNTLFSSAAMSTSQLSIYSETLLMNLPVPDFSMPYNVICLTCTVIAIAFGSLHNFTTRKFVFFKSRTLKEKILHFIQKIISKKSTA